MAMPVYDKKEMEYNDLQDAREVLEKFGNRGLRRLAQFLCAIKFPIFHTITGVPFRFVGRDDKIDFQLSPHMLCVKLDKVGERVGGKERLSIPLEKALTLFSVEATERIEGETDLVHEIDLIDLTSRFFDNEEETCKLFTKTKGKGLHSFRKPRKGLGPQKQSDEWRQRIRKNLRTTPYTPAPTRPNYSPGSKGYVAPEDRDFLFVEFG